MERRTLISTSLVKHESTVVGLDGKPLVTEQNVRDAVARVARDLDDMRLGRGYSEGSGWVKEDPPGGSGEHGILFNLVDAVGDEGQVIGEYAVVGQMILRRA